MDATLLNMLLVLFLVVVPASVLFYQFAMRYVISYRLTNRSVLIMLLWVVPIFRISYRHIQEIRVPGRVESPSDLIPLNFCNRLWGRPGYSVLIRRKWGLPVLVSPDDPDEFLHELRQRAHQRTGEWLLVS